MKLAHIYDEKRFNVVKKQFITLSGGEEFCKKCRGKGVVPFRGNAYKNPNTPAANYLRCSECLGDGKIDWVERATGKNGGV